MNANDTVPTFADATAVWWRIGLLSFGGPAAQIALMHRTLVDERRWLSEREFLDALGFCMLLPGPEAMQLATYAGRRLHGTRGGLIAGGLFVLPGALLILVLASLYARFGSLPLVQASFVGVQAAVVVIVIEALLKVARRALHGRRDWLIAAGAFVALFLLDLPFPLVIAVAAMIGVLSTSRLADPSRASTESPASTSTEADIHEGLDANAMAFGLPGLASTLRTAAFWFALWWLPLLALGALPDEPLWFQLGSFFSMLATLTFGGAYAVLAWMVQDVVAQFGWLSGEQMLDALGLAETTPGPLILVTEFVGYLAAWPLGGFWYGVAGAAITLWATFVPCFLWIFTFAPWIDRLSRSARVRGALSAITAAVVGVILNLSLWFALQVFFADVNRHEIGWLTTWVPDIATVQPLAIALSLLAGVLLLRLHWPLLRVLAALAALGALTTVFAG